MRRVPAKWSSTDQPAQLERWISQRTWGRVKNLSVEKAGDNLIIHGRAGTYYHKQLALAAAMESVDPHRLIVDIDVVKSGIQVH